MAGKIPRQGRTRRGNNPVGHRLADGSLRVVGEGIGGWSLTTGKPAGSDYVGRVGALAVALGVGGFFVGFPAVAAADTRSDSSQTSGATSGSTDSSGSSAATSTRDQRSRVRSTEVATGRSQADSADSGSSTSSTNSSVTRGTGRDSVRLGGATVANDSPVAPAASTATGAASTAAAVTPGVAVADDVVVSAAVDVGASAPVVTAQAADSKITVSRVGAVRSAAAQHEGITAAATAAAAIITAAPTGGVVLGGH